MALIEPIDSGCDMAAPLTALDPAALRRTAAVVRNRRDVANAAHFNAGSGQRADGRFAARARPGDAHFHRAHAMIFSLVGGVHGRLLGGEGRALARSAKT